MENRLRLQMASPESKTEIGVKLKRLVSQQEELKIAYHQLKSQIKTGLAEAEEVFSSLAIPLMNLVGLKTEEMAEEGRFTTIIADADFSPEFRRNGLIAESPVISPTADGREWNDQIHTKEESCLEKVKIAQKEFYEKQHMQFMQLVHLLRQVENRVNSHQDDMLQSLATERVSLQQLFQKVFYYIFASHSQDQDTLLITGKLLQVIFDKTDAVLSSVEGGIQNLMQDLTEGMCNPMVEYVKGLRADLKNGTCALLLAIVNEMECSMSSARIELDEARERARVAEEGRIKALCKLKEKEENLRRMKEYHDLLAQIQEVNIEYLISHKFLGMEEAKANDNKLKFELQRKVRKFRTPGTSTGPRDLLSFESNKKHRQSTRARPSFSHRPLILSHLQALSPQTPCLDLDARFHLGLSPSCAIPQVVPGKRISPRLLNP